MAELDVYSLIRRNENNLILGNVKISKYVFEHFWEDTQTIEAYLNSKHISGDKDSLGRDKPFFNIVLAARNIWFRATDLDRKNIITKAKKSKDQIASYLFTLHLQKWMKDTNFGQFLNDWGLQLSSYNACVSKWIENDEGLTGIIIPWNRLIPDILNFNQNPVIEILELTQQELRSHPEYDQEVVEKLIQGQVGRRLIDRQPKDVNKPNYVRLYEVHGEMPLSWLTDNEKDKNTYVQQMHVVSFIGGKTKGTEAKFTLYRGKEKQSLYHLAQLVPNVDGSISLMGAVKSLFEAQWMMNHTIKNIKDQLDLASKTIYQTADPAYANKNALENIETGQIMVWNKDIPNGALTQVNSNASDIGALESFMSQWRDLTQNITNTPNVMSGMASSNVGAYRKEILMIQQAQANFDIMTQNKGLALEEIFRKYITPYILKGLNNSKEIVAELDAYGIDKIDKAYISSEATKRFQQKAVKAVLKRGELMAQGQNPNSVELPTMEGETQQIQSEVSDLGNMRFIKPSDVPSKTWKEVFKEFEACVQYNFTDENEDKQMVLQGLNQVFQTLMNPIGVQVLQTPAGKLVFNEILSQLGIVNAAQLDYSSLAPQPQPQQQTTPGAINPQSSLPQSLPQGIPPQMQDLMRQNIK
jgi:hypothetical protein